MRPRKHRRDLPACVYHRHGAYYYVRRGTWHRLGTVLHEALQEHQRLLSEDRPPGGCDHLFDLVLRNAKRRNRAPNTLASYTSAAKKLREIYRDFRPEQIRPQHVHQMMEHYLSQPVTANRLRTLLKMALDQAVLRGEIPSNPVLPVPRAEEIARDRYITDDEYQRILAHSTPEGRVLWRLLYLTGQRLADVLGLREDQIGDEGITWRTGKSKDRLLLQWNPALRTAVEEARALHGPARRMLLVGIRTGKKRSRQHAWEMWSRACKAAGVADAHIHDLRAKALTDVETAHGKGAAQALAGHSSSATTEVYLRQRRTVAVSGPGA